jgi:hypothetical protein
MNLGPRAIPGLGPGIHAARRHGSGGVDGRIGSGHDNVG